MSSTMRSAGLVLACCAIVSLSCSTAQVLTHAEQNLVAVSRDISVTVTGGDGVDPTLVDEVRRHTMGRLIVAGFDIAPPSDAGALLRLEVHVTRFVPGSAALRLTIGFGAGRGSLLYTATYLDIDGRVLASMDGQERFTGAEIGWQEYGAFTPMGDAEKVRSVLVQEAAKHIAELGLGQK